MLSTYREEAIPCMKEIEEAMTGNLCRGTGYKKIGEAMPAVARIAFMKRCEKSNLYKEALE